MITAQNLSIVWCIDSPGFGGSEVDLLRVLDMLREQQFQHTVAHGNPLDPRLQEGLKKRSVATIPFTAGSRIKNAPGAWLSANALLRQFRGASWVFWMHHSDTCRWLQQRLASSGEHYVLAERMGVSSKEDFRRSRLSIPLKRRAVRGCRAVAILAQTQMVTYCDVFGLTRKKIRFVPNSRDVVAISSRVGELRVNRSQLRQKLQLPEDRPVIICIGSLDDRKAQDVLVRGVAELRSSGVDAHLCLLGAGPNLDILTSLCAELLPNRHTLGGYQEDPIPWLAAADIYAFPSRAEGLPGTLIEAMAASLPCVVTNITGNRELIRDGETGLLVPLNSPDALANGIRRLLSDPTLAKQYANAGHKLVIREYDESCEKEAWLRLIQEVRAQN